MDVNYNQSSVGKASSQSAIMLSMLMLILLTGRALYVAISTDASLKGIFILIMYSAILIFVGFIAGANVSRMRTINQQSSTSISQTQTLSKPVLSDIDLTRFNTSEQFIIKFLLDNDSQCRQSDLVKCSNMTNSKISRSLAKLESRGVLSRVRDGMGKRVNLHKSKLE